MSKIVGVAILLFISQAALAKVTTADDAAICAQALIKPPTALQYDLSDLEGLFFDLVQKVEVSHEVPESRAQFWVNDMLSMKAQILNRITKILPMVEDPKALGTIYQIVDSMGIQPENYGLSLDNQSRVIRIGGVRSAHRFNMDREVKNPPIGFVKFGPSGGYKLPNWLHRSIGFGTQRVETYAPPQRSLGHIQRSISPEDQNLMSITDPESKTVHQVDLRILTSPGAQFEDKSYFLQFNREIFEWVVAVENRSNPTGKIGF